MSAMTEQSDGTGPTIGANGNQAANDSTDESGIPAPPDALTNLAVEIERHVAASGWDQQPMLFALVDTADLVEREPALAGQLGLSSDTVVPGSLTPIEQEQLTDAPLDEALAQIMWPDAVLGCALTHEVLTLPPAAEEQRPEDADPVEFAAAHPDRREVRMSVAVLRDGSHACALRVRNSSDDVLIGADLAPNLSDALLATLR